VHVRLIDSTDELEWQTVLKQCTVYDTYHTAAYHKVETRLGKLQSVMFVYQEDRAVLGLPLVLRPLTMIKSLKDDFKDYYDATSVYGYPGPITSQDWSDRCFFERAGQALHSCLHERHIIAAFSRLHPILQNDQGLYVGDIVPLGETVSIDLSLPVEEQFRQFRKGHRYDIRKARSADISVLHDEEWIHFSDFVALYLATMRRVNANSYYYFDRAYFEQLRAELGNTLHLFVAKQGDQIISGALFTLVNGIVQYHLSGSSSQRCDYAASKLVIDEARRWATAQGATLFHLGGGVGSQSDSLFSFKSGFSPQRHVFKTWRFIVDSPQYELATHQHQAWLTEHKLQITEGDFFPLYRSSYSPLEQHIK